MNRIGISNFSWLIKFLFFFFLFKLNQLYSVIIIQTLGAGGEAREELVANVSLRSGLHVFMHFRFLHPPTFSPLSSHICRLTVSCTIAHNINRIPFSWIKFTEFVPLKAETFFRNSRMKTIVPPHIVFRARSSHFHSLLVYNSCFILQPRH